MPRPLVIFLLIVLAVAPKPAAAKGQKWALVVGVGRYKSPAAPPLRGPLNDVPAITQMLTDRYQYPVANIHVLMNEEATRAAILEGWEWLIDHAAPGDQAVFYFSGHGTQIPDSTKPNGIGSALCPYDAAPNTLIAGREIKTCIDRLHTDDIVVIVDACHSGLATRSPFMESRLLPLSVLGGSNKALPAQSELAPLLAETAQSAGRERFLGAARVGREASGFAFLKTQRPSDNPMMGALTYYLLDELRRDPKGTLTYAELGRRVTAATSAKAYQTNTLPQEPVCTGPDVETTPFLRSTAAISNVDSSAKDSAETLPAIALVRSVQGREVTLDAIAGAPLEPGDQLVRGTFTTNRNWRIAREKSSSGDGASKNGLSVIRVNAVGGLSASGTLMQGNVTEGDRLFLAVREQNEAPFSVAVEGAQAKTLIPALRALPFVHLSTGEAGELVNVVLHAAGGTVTPVREGAPLSAIAPGDLRRLMESLQAVQILADISCPQPPFQVTLRANAIPYRAKAFIGSDINLTIETDKEVWIILASINAAGNITAFPEPFLVHANQPFRVGPIKVEGPAGFDLLRAFAFPTRPDIHLPATRQDAQKLGATPYEVARAIAGLIRTAANHSVQPDDNALLAPAGRGVAVTGWAVSDLLLEIKERPVP